MSDNIFERRMFNQTSLQWGEWHEITTEQALQQSALKRDDVQIRVKRAATIVLRLNNLPVSMPANIEMPVPANVVIDEAVIDRFLRFYLDGSYPSIKTKPREAFTQLLKQTFGSDPLPERR